MWIFTKYGFFSAVCAQIDCGIDPDTIMVRARKQEHLESLKQRFALEQPIMVSAAADYRYRILLDKATWIRIVAELAGEIDYPNFKDQVAQSGDSRYEDALHEVWAVMYSIQH